MMQIRSFGRGLLLTAGIAWFMASCDYFTFRADNTLLAKAYNSRLYLEDMQGLIPAGTDPADSAAFVKRYVDRWLINQAFLHAAMQSLALEELDIEQRVKDYKNALLMHEYESYLISSEMDTVVTEAQIRAYYEENHAYFNLKEHIISATYIKLPLRNPETNRIRALYRSSNPENLSELEELCLYNAATYYINHDSWMAFNEILRDMPLRTDDPAAFLRNNRFSEITDDYFRYFLYVHDYRLRGDVSPMDFEYQNIRMFIMNHRKKQFVEEKRRELFNQAIEANRIEVYF